MKKTVLTQLVARVWLSKRPRSLFYILCFFEFFYKVGFYIHQKIRKFFGGYSFPEFKVISVGNLMVGGTGKSVLIRYLAERIGPAQCAIISRGYGGSFEKTGQSYLVSDGESLFATVAESGDEAFMFAEGVSACVVVGKNRKKSAECVEILNKNRSCCYRVRYLLLDDAYQNHHLKKDVEILLLDARQAFGNNHCLPAGPLREKNFKNANLIILTHANALSETHRLLLKNIIAQESGKIVFTAAHGVRAVKNVEGGTISLQQCAQEKVFMVAGIGSFLGFKSTVQNLGCQILGQKQFGDHHYYTINDLETLGKQAKDLGCSSIITTEKDWTKISSILSFYPNNELAKAIPWFMVSIGFQFLVPEEEIVFFDLIKERLEL